MSSRVDARLVADQAAALHRDGCAYTARQLYYAVCAEMERPELDISTGQIISGLILTVGGLVGCALASFYLLLVVVLGLLLTGNGVRNRRRERHRPTSRPLALAYDDFLRDGVRPRDRADLPGLLADNAPETATSASGAAVVVCDRIETARMLAANLEEPGVAVVVDGEVDAAAMSGRRVLALHDADLAGCGLRARLLAGGAADVEEVGIRPRDVLERRVQLIEGAPCVVPVPVARLLTPEEVVWLADGRRVELATLRPAETMRLVRSALGAARAASPG